MKFTLTIAFCSLWLIQTNAQFGNTPQVLTQSTNANQLGIWHADIDADGDPDVLTSHENSLIWYPNDGAGNFSTDRELIAAEMTFSLGFLTGVFKDLNADGLPDLAFDRFWRKGLGNGQFAPQATIFANPIATLCDVDSDGLPDAITREYTKMYWQRNLGTGSFATRQIVRTVSGAEIYNLTIDLNADGKQDFLAQHNNACFWYKNVGNNQFDTVKLFAVLPQAVFVGDLDGNGKSDMLTGTGGNILWHEFDANGQRTLRQTLTKYYSGELSMGDLDADGDSDLFVGSVGIVGSHRAKYFAFDATTGLFDPVPKSHNTSALDHGFAKVADFTGDGQPDILVGGINGTFQIAWLKNLAPGSFSTVTSINRRLGLAREIEIADLENDGDMDIFAVGIVLENLGSGQYATKRPASAGTGSRAFSGDIDGDGTKDIALPFGDSISWRKGLGNGVFATPKLLPGLVTNCKQVGGGDLDGDGDIDLFAANGTDAVAVNARFYWFENDGTGNFTGHLLETGIQYCSGAFALDANEDNRLDIVLLFFNSGTPRIYQNLGGGNFAAPINLFPIGTPSPSNVNQDLLTDLDGDGRIDYIFSTDNLSSTKVAWFRNLGAAGFSTEKSLATMGHQGSVSIPHFCVFDANLDGLTDVVVSDFYYNRFLYIRGLGNSAFSGASTVYDEAGFGDFYAVAPHDVDGDGKLDLVYGNTKNNFNMDGYNRLSWLKNNYPSPAPALQTVFNSSTCDDGGTPLDATDDRQVMHFKVIPIGNTAASTRYILYDEIAATVLDTFVYGEMAIYALPPGSAGLYISSPYSFRDLANPDLEKYFYKPGIAGCSPDAPTAIGVNYFKAACDDSGTPNDPLDDRVLFEIEAALYKGSNDQYYYTLNSNLGLPLHTLEEVNIGGYKNELSYFLPEGSATVSGQITLTLRDSLDPSIFKEFIFDNPGTCASTPLTCPTDIFYTKQSQIDAFPIIYPNCRIIEGSVTLKQSTFSGATPIENLNGLSNIEIIRGDLDIDGIKIQNLQGLHALDSIGGNLYLYANAQLQDLEGVNSLKSISGSLDIYDAPALQNLDGLDSLNWIGNSLFLQILPVLENLTALQHLTDIPGLLWLDGCNALPTLTGLHNLTNIGENDNTTYSGQIAIANCPLLENLTGLDKLKSLSSLLLQENIKLKNLSGLEALDTIRLDLRLLDNPTLDNLNALSGVKSALLDDLFLKNNDALTNLSGIGNLDLSLLDALEISQSALLSGCAVPNICQYLESGGNADIGANKLGCNSTTEVLAACNAPLTAALVGSSAICAGDSTNLTISFSGDGPYTFVLAVNAVPQPAVTTQSNPHIVSVAPISESIYALMSVSNGQGSGMASGSANVAVFALPVAMIAAPDSICLGDTVVLSAFGGTLFKWNNGQSTSLLEVYPSITTNYTVTVTDANNCSATAAWLLEVEDCISGVFSAGYFSENIDFQVFPNPVNGADRLYILLGERFTNLVKIELLALDGRLLQSVFREKTAKNVVEILNLEQIHTSFFIRISDRKTSVSRLIIKL